MECYSPIYFIIKNVTLKDEEIEVLETLNRNSTNNTVRKRSQCLVLSHQRRTITDLASIFNASRRTIERWYDDWKKQESILFP